MMFDVCLSSYFCVFVPVVFSTQNFPFVLFAEEKRSLSLEMCDILVLFCSLLSQQHASPFPCRPVSCTSFLFPPASAVHHCRFRSLTTCPPTWVHLRDGLIATTHIHVFLSEHCRCSKVLRESEWVVDFVIAVFFLWDYEWILPGWAEQKSYKELQRIIPSSAFALPAADKRR